MFRKWSVCTMFVVILTPLADGFGSESRKDGFVTAREGSDFRYALEARWLNACLATRAMSTEDVKKVFGKAWEEARGKIDAIERVVTDSDILLPNKVSCGAADERALLLK